MLFPVFPACPPHAHASVYLSVYSVVRLLPVFVCLPHFHVNFEGRDTILIIIASLAPWQVLNNYFLNDYRDLDVQKPNC